jgi:hypothetical protein
MGRWLLAAAMIAPSVADANPGPPAPASAKASDTAYAVDEPVAHNHLSDGWGLYATLGGRSMDVSTLHVSQLGWADDPRVQRNDVEAGYGWRRGGASALIGFDQHDYGPKPLDVPRRERDPNEPPAVSSDGVLGLSFVLRGR